jgi:3-oxoacyl-[acyl-carrier protein] reductase
VNIGFDFTGRTVLVTGAAAGIGRELAAYFHRAGARLVALDRDPATLAQAWPDSDQVRSFDVDVSDPDAVAPVFGKLSAQDWSVDTVVNNAGITRDTVVWKMTDADWRAVLGVHLTGTFNLTRAAIPGMRQRSFGRIVNVTSYSGIRGNVGQANYSAAKAGIIGFTKTVAKEVARFGITVNAISPNAATAMVAQIPQAKLNKLTSLVPLGRFAEPAEMAPAVAFLASDEAAYVTGVVLPVDGGVSM